MDNKKQFKNKLTATVVLPMVLILVFMVLGVSQAFTEEPASAASGNGSEAWAYMAAAIAFGLGAIGAGIAISSIGAAAMGAIAEKPEVGGQALIFVALAEGIVVIAMVIAIMILGKV